MITTDATKVKVAKVAGAWVITCEVCDPTDLFAMFTPPWAAGVDHHSAVLLAQWHANLHAERRCPTCHHAERLPRITKVEQHTFRFEGRLYALRADGPREVRDV